MSLSAEVICVGTELLLGDIQNSNAQFLAQQLAQLGIPHYYQTVVGDNVDRLKRVIALTCERSQLVIFTGGLGPTPDDLTTAVLADFFGAPLIEHPEVLAGIRERYRQRGEIMPPSNYKQALLPLGAEVLPNPSGTAPGMIWQPRADVTILTFPGVPTEMHQMWQQTAVPFLRDKGWGQEIIYSRMLRFWGISEAALAEKVAALLALSNPTVAPYAGRGEVRLRISARADSEVAALQLIEPIEQQIRQIAGIDYFGTDDDTLAKAVGEQLQLAQETLAVAESCTGGDLGAMVTSIPGSSDYFLGGIIAYDNAVKVALLDVNPEDLDREGAVSATVAKQMAAGVRQRLETTWGLGITGIAGPGGGTASKPVGLVYVGLAGPGGLLEHCSYILSSFRGRAWIQRISACNALDQLRRHLILRQQSNSS